MAFLHVVQPLRDFNGEIAFDLLHCATERQKSRDKESKRVITASKYFLWRLTCASSEGNSEM